MYLWFPQTLRYLTYEYVYLYMCVPRSRAGSGGCGVRRFRRNCVPLPVPESETESRSFPLFAFRQSARARAVESSTQLALQRIGSDANRTRICGQYSRRPWSTKGNSNGQKTRVWRWYWRYAGRLKAEKYSAGSAPVQCMRQSYKKRGIR